MVMLKPEPYEPCLRYCTRSTTCSWNPRAMRLLGLPGTGPKSTEERRAKEDMSTWDSGTQQGRL